MMDRWEYNLALVIAGVVVWAGVRAHRYWLSTRRRQIGSSPTAGADPMGGVKNQANAVMTPILTPPPAETGKDSRRGRPPAAHDLDRWVANQPMTSATTTLVRRAQAMFGVSRATVMRALRRARAARSGGER